MLDPETDIPEGFGALEWKDVTNIHPLGLAAVIILGVAMLLLPRRWAILPMIIIACFVSSVQKIAIFSLDFNLLRIMVLFGATRIMLRGEMKDLLWKPLDTAMVLWVISAIVMNTLLMGTISDFVNRLGFAFDALGMYFLFRYLIHDWEDVDRLALGCIIISIPVAVLFLVENRTGWKSVFDLWWGAGNHPYPRRQGALSGGLLTRHLSWLFLGSVDAAVCRAVVEGPDYWLVLVCAWASYIHGHCAPLCIKHTSCSSLLWSYGWPDVLFRHYMKLIRWGALFILVALHMVMKTPVWHLIARIDFVSGSTGYHRYLLIDQAIKHFGEWWLIGIRSTLHWEGLFDITNQYIWEGVQGGFLTLALFVTIIVLAFRGIGRSWRISTGDRYQLALFWALGVSLFVHCMNFLGVSYFGQIYVLWYLLLAIIGSISPATARLRHWTPAVIQNLTQRRNAAAKIPQLNGGLKTYAK